ncbi:hypothetical protein NIES2130_13285 [Scytonema sp. HK-05]|nr:hypothetical protein NIES2130_13285 [Scytonema sp. HK-05]
MSICGLLFLCVPYKLQTAIIFTNQIGLLYIGWLALLIQSMNLGSRKDEPALQSLFPDSRRLASQRRKDKGFENKRMKISYLNSATPVGLR